MNYSHDIEKLTIRCTSFFIPIKSGFYVGDNLHYLCDFNQSMDSAGW